MLAGKSATQFLCVVKMYSRPMPHAKNFISRVDLLRLTMGARLFPFHSRPGAASLFSGCADVAIVRPTKPVSSAKRFLAFVVGSLLLTTNLTMRMTTTIIMIIKTTKG